MAVGMNGTAAATANGEASKATLRDAARNVRRVLLSHTRDFTAAKITTAAAIATVNESLLVSKPIKIANTPHPAATIVSSRREAVSTRWNESSAIEAATKPSWLGSFDHPLNRS